MRVYKASEYDLKYISDTDIKNEIEISQHLKGEAGEKLGFPQIDQYFSTLHSEHCILYGEPNSGKTTWLYNVLINQSKRDGNRALIWGAEEKDSTSIFKRLIYIFLGQKTLYGMSDQDLKKGFDFVNKHFVILETGRMGVTFKTIETGFADLKAREADHAQPIKTMVLDHALMFEIEDTHEKHVRRLMGEIIDHTKINKIFTWVVNHISKPTEKFDSTTKLNFIPPQNPTNLAGGQMWFRLAYNMIEIYRPNPKIYSDVGKNEAWVIVRKVKNPDVGKTSYEGEIRLAFVIETQNYETAVDPDNSIF